MMTTSAASTNASTSKSTSSVVSSVTAKLTQGQEITPSDLELLHNLHHDGREEDYCSQIPFLDRDYMAKADSTRNVVVRHFGMVQDMLDPEYYISECQGQSMHFREPPLGASSNMNDGDEMPQVSPYSNLAERQPLVVVPVPFASQWWSETLAQNATRFYESSTQKNLIPESPPAADAGDAGTRKRDRTDNEEADLAKTKPRRPQLDTPSAAPASMECDGSPAPQGQELDWWPVGCMGSHSSQCPTLAKFYYDQTNKNAGAENVRKLRLNDVVECIGVLSMDPWDADFGIDEEETFFQTPLPPPSRLPRLHVLSYKIIDLDAYAAQHGSDEEMKDENEPPSLTMSSKPSGKELLKQRAGDSVLAEAVWMTLMSKAERKRSEMEDGQSSWEIVRGPEHALGCASLQISNSGNSTKFLYQQIVSIVKEAFPVVATLEWNCQKEHTTPTKLNGRMTPSPWQLPKGAALIVHVANPVPEDTNDMRVLHEIISQHRIPYTFDGGMQVPFDADYTVIVVSSDKVKLPCSLHLTVEDIVVDRKPSSSSSIFRNVLLKCRKNGNIGLPKEVLEKAQDSYLARRSNARKLAQPLPTEEDFHRWLTLTRLQARGRNATKAGIVDWESALRLDDAMQDRGS